MTVRDDFAAEFARCYLCGTLAIHVWPPALETHEISRGTASRSKSVDDRCALVRTCRPCHRERLDAMPIARQLALKKLFDPRAYDRQRVNLLRNREPDAVTEGEVMVEVIELEAMIAESGSWNHQRGYPYPRIAA
jgi:hypothetical protein